MSWDIQNNDDGTVSINATIDIEEFEELMAFEKFLSDSEIIKLIEKKAVESEGYRGILPSFKMRTWCCTCTNSGKSHEFRAWSGVQAAARCGFECGMSSFGLKKRKCK